VGPNQDQKMRYFTILLCRIFTEKSKTNRGQRARVSGILGQKMGYDSCVILFCKIMLLTDGVGFWILLKVTPIRGLISFLRFLTHPWSVVFMKQRGWSRFR